MLVEVNCDDNLFFSYELLASPATLAYVLMKNLCMLYCSWVLAYINAKNRGLASDAF